MSDEAEGACEKTQSDQKSYSNQLLPYLIAVTTHFCGSL